MNTKIDPTPTQDGRHLIAHRQIIRALNELETMAAGADLEIWADRAAALENTVAATTTVFASRSKVIPAGTLALPNGIHIVAAGKINAGAVQTCGFGLRLTDETPTVYDAHVPQANPTIVPNSLWHLDCRLIVEAASGIIVLYTQELDSGVRYFWRDQPTISTFLTDDLTLEITHQANVNGIQVSLDFLNVRILG